MPNEQRGEYIIFLLMPIMATSLVFAGRYAMVNGVEVEVLELGRKKSKSKKCFQFKEVFLSASTRVHRDRVASCRTE
jgi:hypothetical protein